MPSSSCSADQEFLVYYGAGGYSKLEGYRRVALQANHHPPAELRALARGGTEPLSYLSLSEDTGPSAPWQRQQRNAAWGGAYVYLDHPGWLRRVVDTAEASLERGCGGFFLDTLEPERVSCAEREALIGLVRALRSLAGPGFLVANRGFGLGSELAELVDAFNFEAFSTTWVGGYRALAPNDLLTNAGVLNELRVFGRPVFALDYAGTPELAEFARARARVHALPSQVSDRLVTCLPEAKRMPAEPYGSSTGAL